MENNKLRNSTLEGEDLTAWLKFLEIYGGHGIQVKIAKKTKISKVNVNKWFKKNAFPYYLKMYQENVLITEENIKLKKKLEKIQKVLDE